MNQENKITSSNKPNSSGLLEPPSPTLATPLPTASATGNPRNKCALKPGHSLLDWIRLGNSGRDLTGVGGRIQGVSPRELASHNTIDDAWLAIRGKVYNITHYLNFHPGGVDELMKGAGIDATQLFEQIHPWVNYEQLLAKCLVGPLRVELSEPLIEQKSLVRRSVENLAGRITSKKKESRIIASLVKSTELPLSMIAREAAASPPPPRIDWIQTTDKCTIVIYIRQFSNPGIIFGVDANRVVNITLIIDDIKCNVKIESEKCIEKIIKLRSHIESGKIEIVLKKSLQDRWSSLGSINISSWEKRKDCDWLGVLENVTPIARDVVLMSFSCANGDEILMPVASHVKLHMDVEGSWLVRSYTPLSLWLEDPHLNLAVKSYPNGAVSSRMSVMSCLSNVKLTGPYTNFQIKRLKNVNRVYMFAAGSGITPMLSLIMLLLQRRNPKCQLIQLLFFNRTEEDIIFKDKLTELAGCDERLKFENILSQAESTWTGRTGRVRRELITELIQMDDLVCNDSCQHFFFICGPTEYTKLTKKILYDVGCKDCCIHDF